MNTSDVATSEDASRADVAQVRRQAVFDLIVGYGTILVVIWAPEPWRRALYFVVLGWIAFATWRSFESWQAMGLRASGFLRSLWVVGVASMLALAAVVVSRRMQVLHAPQSTLRFIQSFWGYAIWSFFQQFLLQDFVLRRLMRLLPSRMMAVGVAAGLFALAHLPNPVLTVLTLVWGLLACLIYLRYRNLFTLGLAHAVLGVCVAITVPAALQHNMRVGLGYITYRPQGKNIQGLQVTQLSRSQGARTASIGMTN